MFLFVVLHFIILIAQADNHQRNVQIWYITEYPSKSVIILVKVKVIFVFLHNQIEFFFIICIKSFFYIKLYITFFKFNLKHHKQL